MKAHVYTCGFINVNNQLWWLADWDKESCPEPQPIEEYRDISLATIRSFDNVVRPNGKVITGQHYTQRMYTNDQ